MAEDDHVQDNGFGRGEFRSCSVRDHSKRRDHHIAGTVSIRL